MGNEQQNGVLDTTSRNAAVAWLLTLGLCVLALFHAMSASYRWFAFTGVAVVIIVIPATTFRDATVMPPWELLVLVVVPVLNATLFGQSFLGPVAVYIAVAAVALIVAVEIHRFTPARMNHLFAVALVVIATLAVAAVWNIAQWTADATLGTEYIVGDRSQDAANDALMINFLYAAVAGVFAGIVFDRYFRMQSDTEQTTTGGPTAPSADEQPPVSSLVADQLDLSERYVLMLSWGMQVILVVVLLYGLVILDLPTVVNASIALGITFLPGVLEDDYRIPLEPELVFWLTSAVFLHALGSAGLYDLLGLWDTLTHTISASIVAAAGYAVVRAIDLHTDEIHLPPTLMAAFILLFVLAFGVLWEIVEFAIDLSAEWFGFEAVVSQHGINDTIGDLIFDFVGAVVAAVWGSFYLTTLSSQIADRFG